MSAPATMARATPATPSTPQSAEVARARVAIMVATYQVDVVLPTKFSVETFMDDLVSMLAASIDDETVDFTAAQGHWTLAQPGRAPIPRWSSLEDHDITDGALLMLSTTESAEAFTPLVEDITDALARINEREFAEFDSETAASAGLYAFGAASIVVAVLLSWSWTRTGSVLWCCLPALILAALTGIAALAAYRRGADRLGLGLILSAVPLLFTGAATMVPTPYG
ncbi:type VII secretion integral membrane protein EccD, partial [Nocardia tengchongensis]